MEILRRLNDETLPCQHCGQALDVIKLALTAMKKCPYCKGVLPQNDIRNYGATNWRRNSDSVLGGFPQIERHWTESYKNLPLWALMKE